MSRKRLWIRLVLVLFGLGLLANPGFAMPSTRATECAETGRPCSVELGSEAVNSMRRTQEDPNWCWAAVIAMILSHRGVLMRQGEIVQTVYGMGEAINVGASPATLTAALGRTWIDSQGNAAHLRAAVAGPGSAHRLTASTIVSALAQGYPVVFGVDAHVMLLVQVSFVQNAGASQPRIVGGTVLDPTPGQGLRPLRRSEMWPNYVAIVYQDG